MKLFGFNITRKADSVTPVTSQIKSEVSDGAINVNGGHSSFGISFDASYSDSTELINLYRRMARDGYVESAIDDIVNEAIVSEQHQRTADLNLEETDFSDNIKKSIQSEYDQVLKLLRFKNKGAELFRKWYVDGVLYAYKVVKTEKNNVSPTGSGLGSDLIVKDKSGLSKIKILDPRDTKFVREEILGQNGQIKRVDEYYLYTDSSMEGRNEAIVIKPDAITRVTSGMVDDNNRILSFLHSAIKPYNQLNDSEDSIVVYRMVRAPERRIFYVDVGELPKTQAESYMQSIMNKHQNKMLYDANTGKMKESTNMRSMLEDLWIPRREGSRGTEVDTMQGGQSLGEIQDIEYFKKRLFNALKIPLSRQDQETSSVYTTAKPNDITRDEIKFNKYINRLRSLFSELILDTLKTQLILKKVITIQEWQDSIEDINLIFNSDSHFAELKNAEILMGRIELVDAASEHVGKYFSKTQIKRDILKQTEEDIEQIEAEIKEEGSDKEDDDF